jgi:hypothetical protein
MADAGITSLFAAVVEWAIAQGGGDFHLLPGIWQGETEEWVVKINGHRQEIDDVPPYGYLLTHKTALVGLAVGNLAGGCVAGPSEEDLIAHFLSQMPGVAG